MLLTSEMLAELVKSLRSHQSGVEKRREPRVGLRCRVDIFPPREVTSIRVWVRDIGPGGIGIVSPVMMEAEEEFKLVLPTALDAPEFVPCTVRHCRKSGGGQFFVGAQFIARPKGKKA